MITFTLDASIRDDVFVERPGIRSEIEGVTLWVSEVVYTPVQVYLTVDYTVPQALMDAYVEAQGGQPEEKWLQYTPMYLVPWMSNLSLVDGEGNSMYTLSYIGQCHSGTSDSQAWFTFPAISEFPSELYLALYDDHTGFFDLSRSIRVR